MKGVKVGLMVGNGLVGRLVPNKRKENERRENLDGEKDSWTGAKNPRMSKDMMYDWIVG